MLEQINGSPGALVRELRRKRGMTQAQLGARVGLPQGHIARIEAEKVDVKLSTLVALLQVFGHELVAADSGGMRLLAAVQSDKRKPRFA